MLENTSRRTVAKGAAWAIPAIQVANTAPALAASSGITFTGTVSAPQFFFIEYNRDARTSGAACDPATNPSGGYIDTQACTPAGGPRGSTSGVANGDCLRNPNSSIGAWLETASTTSGSAQICNFTTTYTFSQPITIDSCPNGKYNTGGTTTWTECTTLNGWTYTLSADGKTLKLTYPGCVAMQTSTSANGSGTSFPGYFINYHFTSICTLDTATTISVATSYTYYDKANPTGKVYTKNIAARPV